jgi:HEAT repeat protein
MKPQALCWAALLLPAAPLALAAPDKKEEPTYQGKPLSTWLKQLRSDRSKERADAAVALDESIGPKGKAAVPSLIEALKDKEVAVTSRAASALGKVGPAARAAAPALIAALKDRHKDFITRANAARALGKIGAEAKTAVPVLVEALADKEDDVRPKAADALADLGPEARDAVPALRQAFQKHKGDIFFAPNIVDALGHIGKPAVPALVEVLKSGHEGVGEMAAKALGKLGPEAREAVPDLIEMLKKEDARLFACQVLGKIGPEAKTAVPALREALKDKNDEVRQSAAWAFVRIDPGAAKKEGVEEPRPHYYAWLGADGDDFDRDDNASAGGGKIGGRVVLWVNGERAGDYSGGGQVDPLGKWLRPGKNELTLSGRHDKPVYVKVTRHTGGGFEGVIGKRKFPGPGGDDKADPLTFEVERAPKP